MRIYTEVNFQWDDKKGKLVEVSSDSFDYSGEMALCIEWENWETIWYDDAGNAYQLRVHLNSWNNKVDVADVMKSTDGGSTWTKDKEQLNDGKNMKKSTAHSKFKNYVKGKSTSGEAHGTFGSDDGGKAAKANWEATYPGISYSSGAANTEIIKNIDAGIWEKNDEGIYIKVGESPPDGTPEEIAAEKTATAAIKQSLDDWKAIIGEGELDAFESDIDLYVTSLKDSEQDVRDAYKDLFGEDGALSDIEKNWKTATEETQKDFFTESRDFTDDYEGGLKDTIGTRESSLEEMRKSSKDAVRSAEAKISASGFASTGVGKSARDLLAAEIGKEARNVNELFTEERSDMKKSYLTDISDLKEKKGTLGSAYDRFIETRDKEARLAQSTWKKESKDYLREKDALQSKIDIQAELAEEELGGIAADIMSTLGTQQLADESYDPFQSDLPGYDIADFGLSSDSGVYTYDLEFAEGKFDENSYTGYEDPMDDLELFDPNEIMPWDMTKEQKPIATMPGIKIPGIK